MGASGTAIFDDDTAADVRRAWRDAILDGLTPNDAVQRLVAEFVEELADADDEKVFWIALAAAQLETGRLQPGIRDRALEVIASGGDVARWAEDDPGLARHRASVLQRLAAKLRGPQPQPKRLRRPRVIGTSLELGDIVLVRNRLREAQAIFAVVDHEQGAVPADRSPVVEPLLWGGGAIPSAADLAVLPVVMTDEPDGHTLRSELIVVTTVRKEDVFGPRFGEVVARGVQRVPSGDHRLGAVHGADVVTAYASWPFLVEWIAGPEYERRMEFTRAAAGDLA